MAEKAKQEEVVEETPVVDDVEPAKKAEAPAAEEETVSVPKSLLEKMTQDIKDLQGTVSQQRLSEAREKNEPAALPSAFLKVFQGKIVVGWKSEKSELMYHPTNSNIPTGEILKSTYFFIDGTDSGVVDQVLFTRAEDRVNVSITADNGPEVTIKFDSLVTTDYELREKFVLPKEPYTIRKDFLNP